MIVHAVVESYPGGVHR